MRACILLAIAASGCTGSFDPLPNQAMVERIIWNDVYGMTRLPPPVEWLSVDEWGNGNTGMTWAGWKVQVACGSKCDIPVANTSLAHELMHMRSFDHTGDVDAFHVREDWSLVGKAENNSLIAVLDLSKDH